MPLEQASFQPKFKLNFCKQDKKFFKCIQNVVKTVVFEKACVCVCVAPQYNKYTAVQSRSRVQTQDKCLLTTRILHLLVILTRLEI